MLFSKIKGKVDSQHSVAFGATSAVYSSTTGQEQSPSGRKVNANLHQSYEIMSSDEDRKTCIKGRLTVLYRMSLEWKKLRDYLINNEDSSTVHFLKPCSMIYSRAAIRKQFRPFN